jgi:hypothetical protein
MVWSCLHIHNVQTTNDDAILCRNLIIPSKVKRLKVVIFLYSDAYIRRTAPLYKFGILQVGTTSGAVHTVACDGLAPPHPLTAASILTSHPCSRTEDVYPQLRLIPVYRPRRDDTPGWHEHVRVNILPKDVTNWPIWQNSDSNPGLPVSSPALLTTRPTRLNSLHLDHVRKIGSRGGAML